MKALAIAVVMLGLVIYDAAYLHKLGNDYEGQSGIGTLYLILAFMFCIALLMEKST